jgi:subtilisin family serine protease
MKNAKNPRRTVVIVASVLLLLCGIFLTRTFRNNQGGSPVAGTPAKDSAVTAAPPVQPPPVATPRIVRDEPSLTYVSQDGGEKLKLVMDRFVARDANGTDEVRNLFPPATPATLAKRLAEFEAPLGIFPIAIIEGDSSGDFVTITSEIRARVPREQAERIARENGLTIDAMPDYAPEWVVFSASDPFDAMEKINPLRGEPIVNEADILLGRRLVPMELPNDPRVGEQWHLKRSGAALAGTDMNVEGAWDYAGGANAGSRGRGIKIGILDDSFQTAHPDFVGGVDTAIDYDFLANDGDPSPVLTDDNHGTAVGGVAGARGNNGVGVSGVAPEATLVGLRMLGGSTTEQVIADALSHRVDVIQVKNNSWGYNGALFKTEPLLEAALKNAAENGRDGKGTIFTFSAGNSGDEEDSANYSELTSNIYTLVVGATSSKHNRCFYSEPGANVVITAPSGNVPGHPKDDGGLGITTTDRTGGAGYASGDYTSTFNGTSSSCPAVSGAIAVMLEKNPNLGWRDVHEILIRTAVKFNPDESGWLTNAAGLHFNNDYGAGLIDVTAAVNLAETWTNVGPHTSVKSTKTGIAVPIPDDNSTGAEVLFSLPGSNIITEHATVRLSIDHTARGHLEITLFSPSGTASRLAEVRGDLGTNYTDYTFSTVQNWGENSSGTWTLKVADRRAGNQNNGGKIKAAELVVYGVFAPPVNTPPTVRITSPADGSVFSPGVGFNVGVDATDVDIDSNPSQVTRVELYANGNLIETDTAAPFTFALNPANGIYEYVAKAYDPDELMGESLPVSVTVKNQSPVVTSATINAANQAYDDLPLTVTSVTANDPEMDPLTFEYKWEFSTDEVNYQDSGAATATLPPNPANSSKLWRCAIRAFDGNTYSEPYYTPVVNLLDRPSGFPVRPGGTYSYQSGLVLKGDTLIIDRKAIIHEFSQGFSGGTSEWVEILTLQAGNLSNWTLADNFGNSVIFNEGVWDDIPAGTLIVIYNGLTQKDGLLPADDNDPSDGTMVISSANSAFFTTDSVWPTLDNVGDGIFLRDDAGLGIHQVSYGNSLSASPNVGEVGSGRAAYYAGQSDAGASLANEWLTTTATSARTASFAAVAPLDLFPGAVFSNGRYSQDFNTTPGDSGSQFPTGWSSYSIQIATTQTTNFDSLEAAAQATTAGGVFNSGSRIGILGGIGNDGKNRFDPGFFAMALDNTRNLTGLKISYDIIKISEQARSMNLNLEYTTGNPANTGTAWIPISGGSHNSGSTASGTVTRLTNVPLPAIFQNRASPIYLRWYYRTSVTNQGAGYRDWLAIDNVLISSDASPNIFMTLSVKPSTFNETAGSNASVGTITLNQAMATALTVGITSSDVTEATVPASVVIPAGQLSATFPIAAVDDIFSDGTQTATITVSAPGFLNESKVVTVTDNEPILVGVTPALPNNPGNADFVDRIRTGRLTEPAKYYLADGSVLPDGLTLNRDTGRISGTVSPTAALGVYIVVIEIRNVLGGFSSQTIIITVSDTAAGSFAEWIAPHDIADKSTLGDSDFDQLPNLVEYALNSNPDGFETPSPVIPERTANSISLTYSKSKNAPDVLLTVEWSETMADGSWDGTDIVHEVLVDGTDSQTIKSTITIDPAHPAKFMRLRAVQLPR